jgi:hypothetical protein
VRKIRDVMSKRKIAASLGGQRDSRQGLHGRARRAGLDWPLPEGLTDEALEVRLYPPPRVAATESSGQF